MAVEFYITVMWCRKEAFKDYLEVYGYKMKFSDNWEYKQLSVSMKKFQLNLSTDIMLQAKAIPLILSFVKLRCCPFLFSASHGILILPAM